MPTLELHLFGSAHVLREGIAVNFDTRKALALLAYLVVTNRPQSRDVLAALLWPDYDESNARAALRRTLSTMHKAIGENSLEISRDLIGLKAGSGLWSDLAEFKKCYAATQTHGHASSTVCAECLPLLERAASLYADDFLTGFSLRDSPEFDEWQLHQAESLRQDLAAGLEKLVTGYTSRGELDQAVRCARRWLSLDSLHEEAHRQLMRLYAILGQRNEALRQYRDCVRILDQELGVAPLEETTRLYQAISENQLPVQKPALPGAEPLREARENTPSKKAGQFKPPLVGRKREFDFFRQTYHALESNGYFLALEGEAGIGKTRLAEDCLAYARGREAGVLTVRFYEGESGLAYGPLIEGLRGCLAQPERAARLASLPQHWLAETVRLLPELGARVPGLPPAAALDGPGAQSRFFEGLRQAISALCAGSVPGMIFLDDLHWADTATLELLNYLVRRLNGFPLFILAAWRSELAASQPLRSLVAEAARTGLGRLVSLPRLEPAEVSELVQAASAGGPALPENLGQRLYQEAEGLPYFVVEYLSSLLSDQGSLDEHFTAVPAENWSMPASVRELLRTRLAPVDETGRQLLTTAAVIGRSFDFESLLRASGRSEGETVAGLETLITLGLIHEQEQGSNMPVYDFTHEKLRELVYEETSLARRRLLHRRVAEALAAQSEGRHKLGAIAGVIARHYQQAGQEALAAQYFKQAGDHARSLFANPEALEHYKAALALGYPSPEELHQAIGQLLTLAGDYRAALIRFETAAAHAPAGKIGQIEQQLGNVHLRQGEWELAERHFQAALEALGKSGEVPAERALVLADWSRSAYQRGDAARALALAEQSLQLAEASGAITALVQARNSLGILARSREDYPQALHHLQISLQLAEQSGSLDARVAALNNLALAYGDAGDLDEAIRLEQAALAECIRQGDRHHEAALHNNLADLYYTCGQSEQAMLELKKAVVIFAEIGVQAGPSQPAIWKLTEW